MAYKVIKGKNKIRGEQTFVDNITGSVISASVYYGVTFTGETVSGTTGLFTSLTSSVVSASNFYGTNASITTISGSTITGSTGLFTTITGSTITGSTLLSTNITGTYAQLLNLSGTTAQYTTISGSQITGSNIKTTTLSASYVSASQIALTEYLDFNTAGTIPAYRQGRFYYNVNTQDPAFYTSVTGVSIDLAQQTAVKVKNSSGITINKGKLVHIVGGAGANPLIATASWENDDNSANTLGMAMNDMNQNDFGFVLLNGVIEGIDTEGYTAGQIVYLSSSGNYTGTKPQAPLHTVKVGEVIRVQQNNGSMFINIVNGQEIEELHDVRVTSASAGDLLTYSSYNGTPVWVNTKTLSGSYVITGSLTISSSATFTNIGPAIFSGTINTNNNLSGTTAQFTTITATSITGSITSAQTASYASNADLFDNRDSNTFAGTGSNTFNGVQTFNQDITGTHAYFSGDIIINGTASIGMLETRNQQSLVVGDKYIVIMSGATDHTTLDGSGILYGSGSTGPATDENGANAYLRYRNAYDAIEAFPGFRVTGSLAVTSGSTFTTVSGTTAQFTSLTGSFSGSGANLNNIPNGALVNSSVTVGTTSISLGSSATTIQGISVLTGSTVTGSTALFTTITASSINVTDSSIIDVSSNNTALRVTQRGTGESFRVEDETNPDSSPFVIDSDGRVGIATTTPNFNLAVSGTVGISGSATITGSLNTTGSVIVTGSITATSTISGTTGLFTSLTSSQSLVSNIMSVGNYVQYLPVSTELPTNQTASYIYTSGSTNDLYFTQYAPGTNFTNTTRLRWLEGSLSSGLLHGGLLTTVTGTTTFNVSSGSGIIVTYNASTTTDPYPTVKYVEWNNFVSQSLIYSASAPATFIAIDENGAIVQTNIAFTTSQFKDRIVIGRVLHQTGSITDGAIAAPTTAYGISSNTQDFFRACGPVKVNGQILAASGSTLGITKTAGDSYVEGRNYSDNPNIPNYILAADDPALTTTKIYYQWVSGSETYVDTNGGVGYSAIRPAFYNDNGTVTAISPTNNKFTVQRVYWLPKSPTRAFYVSYGSAIYTSLSDAVDAISNEPNYVEGDVTKLSAVYLGAIALEANTTDLTATTKAKIVNGGLFRGTGGGGGGGGGGTTSPGGVTYSLQYNDSGVFNGSANLTFDTTTLTLTGSFNMVGTGSIDIDGGYITGSRAIFTTVSGSTVTGSTALFTTITGSNISGTVASFRTINTNNIVLTGSINATGSININSGSISRVSILNNTTTQGGEIILRSANGFEFAKLRAAASVDGADLTVWNRLNLYQSNASATDIRITSDKPVVWHTYGTGQSPFSFGGYTGFGGEVRFYNIQNNSSSLHVYNGDQIRASFPSGNVTIGKNASTSYALDVTGAVAITGTLNIGTALYVSNTTTTVVGNNVIYNVATASYDGIFVDYTARSGSNARAGQIMAIWSGSTVNYTETTTTDFGSTSGLTMAVVINGTNMQLSASASTANWTVKTIIRTI